MAQTLFPLTFTGQTTLFETLTQNSSSANDDFGNTLINQYSLELMHKFPALFSEQTFTLQTYPSQRFYTLPSQIRKINTVVINVGNTQGGSTTSAGFNWPVKECPTMEYWNEINMVNTITSDIPLYYFFYNGQLGIYPMPAAGYNPITIRAQVETTSISQADYTTGTITSVPLAQTLTALPAVGNTSLAFTGTWGLPTGTYQIVFSDTEVILATLTNGSAVVALQHAVIGTPNYSIAFTAAPTGTSGTLVTTFALASGTYNITFSDGEVIAGTFINGSTAVTFASAISGSPTSVAQINSSTGGNVATMTTAVTVRTAQGGDIVTGSGTSWNASMVGYMFRVPYSSSANGGDNFPYVINQVYSTTQLALNTTYSDGISTITGGSSTYTIGQISIIPTAYQLYPVERALQQYYEAIVKDKTLAEQHKRNADELFAQLQIDQGNKDTSPVVEDEFERSLINPNLTINLTGSQGS